MVEFALVAPILLLLVLGVLESMMLLFSISTARFAVTEAARVDSELARSPIADQQAVAAVRSTAIGQTSLVSVSEIDIYRLEPDPGNPGAYVQDPNAINRYRLDGTLIGSVNWPPAVRDITLANGDYLGVTILYTYQWKTGLFDSFLPAVNQTAVDHLRIEPQVY
ncbi:MAG: TadE/TadG family type IV pilus assembly protein [Candidatus Dormibacteraceae bacterium]